jgi:hypothetical protein
MSYVKHIGSNIPNQCQELKSISMTQHVHQTIMGMFHIAEIDMAKTISKNIIADLLTNATMDIHSHTVFKASPGTVIFGWEALFNVPFIANWNKVWIGRHRHDMAKNQLTSISSWSFHLEPPKDLPSFVQTRSHKI